MRGEGNPDVNVTVDNSHDFTHNASIFPNKVAYIISVQ